MRWHGRGFTYWKNCKYVISGSTCKIIYWIDAFWVLWTTCFKRLRMIFLKRSHGVTWLWRIYEVIHGVSVVQTDELIKKLFFSYVGQRWTSGACGHNLNQCGTTKNKLLLSIFATFTWRLPRKFPAVMSLRDSCHDGVLQFFSGSSLTGLTRLWKSSSTQSIILMMRCGGRPSVRTVAMSDGLIV